jgi:hypothetical protein
MNSLQNRVWSMWFLVVLTIMVTASAADAETDFLYGGFFKFDALHTYYHDGDVAPQSPLRDFHFPGAIPVGSAEKNYDLDYHVKESRFNFTTLTTLESGREVKGFLELDFLLSPAGDERVSNSFNPRLRHFYVQTGGWLFGQTWTTFMVVILPDDLDFAGAAEGVVFGRQPQVRYRRGPWQISLENPETVLTWQLDGSRLTTESAALPDLVIRRNFDGDWGMLGIAAVARQLHYRDDSSQADDSEIGFGVTAGTEIKVGRDDLKLQLTGGRGLGRYVALNFANAAVVDTMGGMTPINEIAGFVAYRHFWNRQWRSTADVSFFFGQNPSGITFAGVNRDAHSASVNLLWSPEPRWTLGVEYMHARRVVEDGTDGQFDRIQFSVRWDFGYSAFR